MTPATGIADLEQFFLILAAIYLTECSHWIRRGGVILHTAWGRTWKLSHPGSLFGNARGALFVSNPLPPLGTALHCHQIPLSLSPQALLSFTATSPNPGWRPPQHARLAAFADTPSFSVDGRKILVNGEMFVKAPSSFISRSLSALLCRVRDLAPDDRGQAIRQAIDDLLDVQKVTDRWCDFLRQTRVLRRLANFLFCYLFLLAPVLLWIFGFRYAGPALLVGVLLQTCPIAWLFRRAHAVLFPDGADERFTPFVTMLLAPPSAIRAPDILARHLVDRFHPLAVARALLSSAQFKTFARHVLLDVHFPILPVCPLSDPVAVRTEEWFRSEMRSRMEKLVTDSGLDVAELLRPRSAQEAANRAYCPRCEAQFMAAGGRCVDCGGRELVEFKPRSVKP